MEKPSINNTKIANGYTACICFTKAENEECLHLTREKDAHITKTEATIRENESEIEQLKDAATRYIHNTCEFQLLMEKGISTNFLVSKGLKKHSWPHKRPARN